MLCLCCRLQDQAIQSTELMGLRCSRSHYIRCICGDYYHQRGQAFQTTMVLGAEDPGLAKIPVGAVLDAVRSLL